MRDSAFIIMTNADNIPNMNVIRTMTPRVPKLMNMTDPVIRCLPVSNIPKGRASDTDYTPG